MKKKAAFLLKIFPFLFFHALSVLCHADQSESEVNHYTLRIINSIEHSTQNFTQGLLHHNGKLYESTGLVGRSSLQRLDVKTGAVEKFLAVPHVFAEGLALFENRLIQLTWKNETAIVYDISDFSVQGEFAYRTEGWGLTSDGRSLIMSDGSDSIYFRNPFYFFIERKIKVTLDGMAVDRINELEYVEGKIYANIWFEKFIVRIDPRDGNVDGIIDASTLFRNLPPLKRADVLNGIAYNRDSKTFYLTGKNWPLIFEVELILK